MEAIYKIAINGITNGLAWLLGGGFVMYINLSELSEFRDDSRAWITWIIGLLTVVVLLTTVIINIRKIRKEKDK